MSDININEDAQAGVSKSSYDDHQSGGSSQQIESSAFPDEDEETITMLDVIEREDKLEEEASAVLGNSDEKNCTYPKGYIARQALYSCATCSDATGNQAAICLACSLECHENHELFELYTKRNYRCDCGNSKFRPDFECKLMDKQTKKASLNDKNKYNHNFSGRYCVCDKRYPPDENDDSAEANDEMWQCIVCEDWYHTNHLGAKDLPVKFDELICGQCADRLEFVHYYKDIDKKIAPNIATNTSASDQTQSTGGESAQESQTSTHSTTDDTNTCPVENISKLKSGSNTENPITEETRSIPCESDTNDSQAENKDPTSDIKQIDDCVLEKLKREFAERVTVAKISTDTKPEEPMFWQDCGWRSMLCRCAKCLTMYKEKDCEFLIDDRDTVQYYEDQGRAMAKNRESPYERGMSALNRMNRAAVVEALHGYDELKADLSTYLRKFADTKKVVREEDIHDFFAQLRTKKRQRLEYE